MMVLLISTVYPLIISSEISYWETFAIIALQGAVGVINFAFRAAYQRILVYMMSGVSTIVKC